MSHLSPRCHFASPTLFQYVVACSGGGAHEGFPQEWMLELEEKQEEEDEENQPEEEEEKEEDGGK